MSTYEAIKSNTESFLAWLKESVTSHYGERCPDLGPGCPCCDAWAHVDVIEAASQGKRKMVKVWCEYDLNGEYDDGHAILFNTTADAWQWLEANEDWALDGTGETFEDLEEQGLLTFTVVEV